MNWVDPNASDSTEEREEGMYSLVAWFAVWIRKRAMSA